MKKLFFALICVSHVAIAMNNNKQPPVTIHNFNTVSDGEVIPHPHDNPPQDSPALIVSVNHEILSHNNRFSFATNQHPTVNTNTSPINSPKSVAHVDPILGLPNEFTDFSRMVALAINNPGASIPTSHQHCPHNSAPSDSYTIVLTALTISQQLLNELQRNFLKYKKENNEEIANLKAQLAATATQKSTKSWYCCGSKKN